MRYAVVLDYNETGMPRDYVVDVVSDQDTAKEYAEAFALGCVLAYLPNGEQGLRAYWSQDAWYVERGKGHPPAIVKFEELT
jgi:hypothetical protein